MPLEKRHDEGFFLFCCRFLSSIFTTLAHTQKLLEAAKSQAMPAASSWAQSLSIMPAKYYTSKLGERKREGETWEAKPVNTHPFYNSCRECCFYHNKDTGLFELTNILLIFYSFMKEKAVGVLKPRKPSLQVLDLTHKPHIGIFLVSTPRRRELLWRVKSNGISFPLFWHISSHFSMLCYY